MGSKLPFECAGCKAAGHIDTGMNLSEFSAPSITLGDRCPNCGGELVAPGGHYLRSAGGLLRRVGPFVPNPEFEGKADEAAQVTLTPGTSPTIQLGKGDDKLTIHVPPQIDKDKQH